MATRTIDIAIIGAGIAGLWAFNRLKRMGYDVLLLEREGIGAGQTLASQGIIHSGLKYAFAGKINELAHSISAMPDLWRTALKGDGAVDLSAASGAASSQYLLIPPGFMGGLIGLVSKKALGGNVTELAPEDWPDSIKQSGFNGSVIYMDEPVLDIAAIIRALAEPYKNCIRKIDSSDPFDYLRAHNINAKNVIFTAAQSNQEIAAVHGHDEGLKTQARPLLMGMMKNAPYPLYAHLVGPSEKPVATITTHKTQSGDLVWYLGGGVAERAKDDDPRKVYEACRKALKKYLPAVDLSAVQWAALPIDRIEGASGAKGWMPDTPTIHAAENTLYCWPTKLTFAPLLSDMILEHLQARGLSPSNHTSDFSDIPPVDYAPAPWDKTSWTSDN
ncbi:MAG: FAD-dependent oxidoreductase [Alphaproteobacteria bacterium]|nr:FAD-dependent oxidoreductase [Alphaproteobacteria bacterium]